MRCGLLLLLCAMSACTTHSYDYDFEAHNVATTPIDMDLYHVAPNGDRRMVLDTEIGPGSFASYRYAAETSRSIASCEAVFMPDDAARLVFEIENGTPAVVDVDLQDGRVVVKERRPE